MHLVGNRRRLLKVSVQTGDATSTRTAEQRVPARQRDEAWLWHWDPTCLSLEELGPQTVKRLGSEECMHRCTHSYDTEPKA